VDEKKTRPLAQQTTILALSRPFDYIVSQIYYCLYIWRGFNELDEFGWLWGIDKILEKAALETNLSSAKGSGVAPWDILVW
jgi:hypothetical protein